LGVERSGVENRWGTNRLEAFSDGVFAIAITLLVLDIRVPPGEFDNLWHGIAQAWPEYLAYATSFITIGGLWLVHHGIIRRLQFANARVMQVNILLLMAVSFLPFPTRLVAEAIHNEDAERAAVIFYGLSLLVIQILLGTLWAVAARDRSLIRPQVSDNEVSAMLRQTTPGIGFYTLVIVFAILAPKVAAFGYLAIAVLAVMRARGDEHGPQRASRRAAEKPT
jgi:uncharacterized membrane protein